MERRPIGAAALEVGAVGLGCMPMSWAYTASRQDGERALRAVRAALDHGVTLLDTADMYGPFTNAWVLTVLATPTICGSCEDRGRRAG